MKHKKISCLKIKKDKQNSKDNSNINNKLYPYLMQIKSKKGKDKRIH